MTARILVTGGKGALGTALKAFLPDAHYLGREELDVTNQEQVWRVIQEESPSIVIHAAAITDHQCPDIGKLIATNIIGTEYVKRACQGSAKLVYLSTHYVYPGETGNYRETDECRPIGTYAWTKFAGERIAAGAPNHLIVRGSWYTEEKLDLWERTGALTDAYCNRVPVTHAALKVARLVEKGAWGIYNLGGDRRTFEDILHDEQRVNFNRRTRADLKLSYPFPADSSTNCEKYDALMG